jgi:hypothetical protein
MLQQVILKVGIENLKKKRKRKYNPLKIKRQTQTVKIHICRFKRSLLTA